MIDWETHNDSCTCLFSSKVQKLLRNHGAKAILFITLMFLQRGFRRFSMKHPWQLPAVVNHVSTPFCIMAEMRQISYKKQSAIRNARAPSLNSMYTN